MAYVTANQVKELRERTGVGMMECKKALVEAQGNIEIAIDNMRKAGRAKAAKKMSRIVTEGIILIKIANNKKYGVIMELNCETDFVAKAHDFKTFGNEAISVALNESIKDVKTLNVRLEEDRTTLINKIGENIDIRRISILEGELLASYLHNERIGVIVSGKADTELLKHIAMHIAASKPEYVHTDDIPSKVVDREYQIQLNIAMQSGKPLEIAEKIVAGRMKKFREEISLTSQNFVMDLSKTVGQLLNKNDFKIKDFIRFEIGEGI
ncbi:translation elongation factor Ts [secondary endosymbiont of Heteropsylla cubana]|uniref:Elongation factor Ts n=1 Tax=secondary endosymbiont of Heteropsylla cubana TaxID=134287 RepID=J3VUF6_9ENTR|nr:translation elongation factor Ts [secondary endosymbiont of Heteropsylla cubana]AFP85786.1 translation elongation factor Ts [secondary endosymbiont of Heteropsylla cubana]